MTLVECIPNFSEGRDAQTVIAIRKAIERVRGVRVLDVSSDAWHHRTVITFAGPADVIVEAAFEGIREARERIDLRAHIGQHPRMGAADVVPFVPLDGVSMDDCVALATVLGERVGRELDLPVYLYERAARRAERRDLAAVRRGGFEGLAELIGTDPARDPDFGPSRIHPSAGAVAIGARPLLVAFNIFMGGAEKLEAVRDLARTVRGSSGGLPGVKALAFLVNGRAQLSMNLTDVDATPAHAVYEVVLQEAERRGLKVEESQLVGLAPERFFRAAGAQALGLPPRSTAFVLEERIRRTGLRPATLEHDRADDVHEGGPSAGGAAAFTAAVAASLLVSLAGRSSADAAAADASRLRAMRTRLEELARLDAAACGALREAEALPFDAPDRDAILTAAVLGATGIPLEIARSAADLAIAAQALGEGVNAVPEHVVDALAAAELAAAAARSALRIVRWNVQLLPDPAAGRGMVEAAAEFDRLSRTAADALA